MATDGIMAVWSRKFPDPGRPWDSVDMLAEAQPIPWTHEVSLEELTRWVGDPAWTRRIECDCDSRLRECPICSGVGNCLHCRQTCPYCEGICPCCGGEGWYLSDAAIRQARLGPAYVDRKMIARAVGAFCHPVVKLAFPESSSQPIWLTDGEVIAAVMVLSYVTGECVSSPKGLVELDNRPVEDSQ